MAFEWPGIVDVAYRVLHVVSRPSSSLSSLIFVTAFMAINLWAFGAMAVDKFNSKCRPKRRTAEARLLAPGALGGGTFAARVFFVC